MPKDISKYDDFKYLTQVFDNDVVGALQTCALPWHLVLVACENESEDGFYIIDSAGRYVSRTLADEDVNHAQQLLSKVSANCYAPLLSVLVIARRTLDTNKDEITKEQIVDLISTIDEVLLFAQKGAFDETASEDA